MKFFSYILTIFCFLPLSASSQSFKSLWKQFEEAQMKDLPKTQMEKLDLIINKAKKEKAYGHLLKASLLNTQVLCSLTPDSIFGEVAKLEKMEQEARGKDLVLDAVWNTVLGCLYRDNYRLGSKSNSYFKAALANPALLARHKVSEYQQLIENGYDGRWFDNDLLSVIGYEAKSFAVLHQYYLNTPLRTAACLTACERVRSGYWEEGKYLPRSERIRLLDSLLVEYGDIKVAGELAVYRYSLIGSSDSDLEEKVNYINYAVSKWGGWPRVNILRNELKKLTQPYFHAYFGNKWNLPAKSRKVTGVSLRNVEEITMTVTRVALDASRSYNLDDEEDLALVKASLMPLNQVQQKRRYIGQPDYKTLKDSLEIPELPVGMYLVELSTENKNIPVDRALYYVSDVQVLAMGLPQSTTRYAVASGTTGQPFPGAHLRIETYDYRKKEGERKEIVELVCDENGETLYTKKSSSERIEKIFAYTESDKYCPEEDLDGLFRYSDNRSSHDVINIFTDRSVYRPGHKLHVAIIAYYHDGKLSTSSIEGKEIVVALKDANRKEVERKTVTTDAFGKASVDFDLPKAGLTGVYTIEAASERKTIRVEQYKRPTYEVVFPEIHEAYQAGDTVVVKGSATMYSGVPVQGATVKYTVRRESAWWWGSGRGSGTVLLERETTTAEDGTFAVEMPMLLPDGASKSYSFYNITAVAEVTDKGGESHTAEIALPLGSRSTVLACDLPKLTERDSLKTIRFDYKNMAGSDVDAVVRYTINNSPKVYTARTNKSEPVAFDPNTLGSGKHKLTAICGTDTLVRDFVLFSLEDKVPCEKTSDWFYVSGSVFPADGRPVYVQVGSSDPDTHVFYTVVSGETVVETGSFDLNNSILCRPFTYQESYDNGILITYAWVKEGKVYTHEQSLSRPLPDRRLKMEWTTFRDRLVPGQKEQWTMKVTRPDGSPAAAQVLATMYDKSLDQIYGHYWQFAPTFILPIPTSRWIAMTHKSFSINSDEPYKLLNEPELQLNHFRGELFSISSPYYMNYGSRGLMRTKVAMMNDMVEYSAPSVEMDAFEKPLAAEESSDEEAAPANKSEKVSLRENLDETAFFLPDLVADTKGNVVMKFTLPESVTTWKMMALATDKDMNYGQITAETVAQKHVMVQPNVPRFLRTNDKATLQARIFNNTEKAVSGKATLTLIDPETQKTVYTQTKNFQLAANQGNTVLFDVQADGKIPVYVCRVTVNGKGYSDGEQHYLPVLPDHETVLRTYPFTQHGPGRMAVKLDQLFAEGITNGKLTVEYTNNPAWLVIQTMPSLAAPVHDDVISQASAYYANTIGKHLLNLSPAIRENIKAWQEEVGDETSLNSPLQKNQELKDLVLSETPWVRVAENESAQKRDLALYFDESILDSRLQSSLYKIRTLQNSDGSWSWWPGMKGSTYMTTSVTETIVRLNHMLGKQQNTASMVKSAFSFLGKYLVDEMKEMKKLAKENKNIILRPNETVIEIMYTFALDGREQPSDVKSAQKYFIDLLCDKATEFTIYGKATAAVIFAANKEKKLADEFVESISQYSVMTEEAGRYFDTPRAFYSWRDYKIPTEVAAIEAFKSVRPDDTQTVEEMRRWLLHEKRGHIWNTYINTVDAAYAFLDGNLQALDNGESTRFTLNGKTIPTGKGTSGIGYVKTTVAANGTQAFAAEKTSEGTSWGALYAQFEQKSTDISASASEISVTREVLGDIKNLKVGDRIKVRITLKAERDLDFVQVVDRRAACMEPVSQLSGYYYGYYCAPQDNQTCYYFDRMPKGTHVIQTEYYIDRVGTYDTGTCKAQCAYAPEYVGTAPAFTLVVK